MPPVLKEAKGGAYSSPNFSKILFDEGKGPSVGGPGNGAGPCEEGEEEVGGRGRFGF